MQFIILPAKIHFFFEMCKKNRILARFFWCRVQGEKCKSTVSGMESTFSGMESTVLGRETTFSGIKSTFLGRETTFSGGDIKKYIKHYTIGGRAYPVRHYPIAIRLRDRKGRAILCSHYFLSVGTLRVLHSECVPSHSFTVVSRQNKARSKRRKREGNLNKKHFFT